MNEIPVITVSTENALETPAFVDDAATALKNVLTHKPDRFALRSSHLPSDETSSFQMMQPIERRDLHFAYIPVEYQGTPPILFAGTSEDLASLNVQSAEWENDKAIVICDSNEGRRTIKIEKGHVQSQLLWVPDLRLIFNTPQTM